MKDFTIHLSGRSGAWSTHVQARTYNAARSKALRIASERGDRIIRIEQE